MSPQQAQTLGFVAFGAVPPPCSFCTAAISWAAWQCTQLSCSLDVCWLQQWASAQRQFEKSHLRLLRNMTELGNFHRHKNLHNATDTNIRLTHLTPAIVTVRHVGAAQNLPATKLCSLRGLGRSLGAKRDGGWAITAGLHEGAADERAWDRMRCFHLGIFVNRKGTECSWARGVFCCWYSAVGSRGAAWGTLTKPDPPHLSLTFGLPHTAAASFPSSLAFAAWLWQGVQAKRTFAGCTAPFRSCGKNHQPSPAVSGMGKPWLS